MSLAAVKNNSSIRLCEPEDSVTYDFSLSIVNQAGEEIKSIKRKDLMLII